MKRIGLVIICLILALGVLGSVFLWMQTQAAPDDNSGPIRSVSTQLSKGYHTAAILKKLRDDQPERVLVVLQNSWELRPTGGFITAFGDGQIVNGQLKNFRVVPSDYFDDSVSLQPPMPAGLAYRISTPYLTMRDANWDVDFPTTAATLSKMYEDATGINPDLVLAVTTDASEHILSELGPLSFSVNGHELEVTGGTVTHTLEKYTDQDFRELGLEWETRKMVLAEFGAALLPAVESWTLEHPIESLRLINSLLATYDVQAWSNSDSLADHLNALGTSRLVKKTTDAKDALMIVDTNVGARKSNQIVTQHVDYRVDLTGERPTITLYITYTHPGEPSPTITDYFDTVRVYAPFGANLVAEDGVSGTTSYVRHGRTVFEGRTVVETASTRTIMFSYELPFAITFDHYRLNLERQPGSAVYPIQITVTDGEHTATLETDSAVDRRISVESQSLVQLY